MVFLLIDNGFQTTSESLQRVFGDPSITRRAWTSKSLDSGGANELWDSGTVVEERAMGVEGGSGVLESRDHQEACVGVWKPLGRPLGRECQYQQKESEHEMSGNVVDGRDYYCSL